MKSNIIIMHVHSFILLGSYRLFFRIDGVDIPLPSPHYLTLANSFIDVNHSHCQIDPCISFGQTCKVRCEVRDKLGYLISSPTEDIILVRKITHVDVIGVTDHVNEVLLTNHHNGTYSLFYLQDMVGSIHLRLRNSRTGEYFREEYTSVIPPAKLAIETCYVNSTIPQMFSLEKTLRLEVVLVDVHGMMVCDQENRFEVIMEVELDNPYLDVGFCYEV